jgi:opacity protein-like surface antigen
VVVQRVGTPQLKEEEYLYVDLGNQSNTIFYNYTGFSSTLTSTVKERDNIVRAGVNYRFW